MMKSKLVGIRIETHGFLLKQIKKIKTPDQNSKTSDIKIAYQKNLQKINGLLAQYTYTLLNIL